MVTAIKVVHTGCSALSGTDLSLISWFLRSAQQLTFRRTGPPVPPWDMDVILGALQHCPFELLKDAHVKWHFLKMAFLVDITSASPQRLLQVVAKEERGNPASKMKNSLSHPSAD